MGALTSNLGHGGGTGMAIGTTLDRRIVRPCLDPRHTETLDEDTQDGSSPARTNPRTERTDMTRDESIQAILEIARDVFGRDVKNDDDFFSLGGDSLNATELAVRLEELLGREIDQHALWDSNTFMEFATLLAGNE